MSAALLEVLQPARPRHSWLRTRLAAAGQFFAAWRRRARARNDLLHADDRMLADLGISRAEAKFLAVNGKLDRSRP
jgi:uncharacterized protein YjiS (DUF1127 family)